MRTGKSFLQLFCFGLILLFLQPASAQQSNDFDMFGDTDKPTRKKKKRKKKNKKDDYDPYAFLYENLDKESGTKTPTDKVDASSDTFQNTNPTPVQNPVQSTVQNPVQNNPPVAQQASDGQGQVIRMNVDDLWQGTIDTVVVKTPRKELSFHDQENVKYYYSQALQQIDGQSYESAIKLLNKSLKKDPNNKELLQIRGNAFVEVGEYKKAIKDFKKVLVIAPMDPTVNYNAASAYSKIGKFKEAIRLYTVAINEKPDYLLAYQGRAASKTMLKEYDSSIEDYNNVIDINAFFTPAYRGRGVAKSIQGYTDQAIMDFTYTLDLTPEDGLSYYYRGLAFSKNKDFVHACEDFIEAYKRNVTQATYELKSLCNYGDLK